MPSTSKSIKNLLTTTHSYGWKTYSEELIAVRGRHQAVVILCPCMTMRTITGTQTTCGCSLNAWHC